MHSLAKQSPKQASARQASPRSTTKKIHSAAVPAYLQRKSGATDEVRDSERESEAHQLTSVAQLKVKVGPSNDHYERQADEVANRVVRGSVTPLAITPIGGQLQRKTNTENTRQAPATIEQTVRNKGPGQPLAPALRRRIEPVVGQSLGHVRLHQDSRATDAVNARAFTHDSDIWLGRGERADNLGLIAHEATHVVQQGTSPGSTVAQRKPATSETSADTLLLQRNPLDKIANAVGELSADAFWALIRRMAPSFEPLLREIADKGVTRFFYDKLKQGVTGLFTRLGVAPGTIDTIFALFENMAGRVAEILTALASGNCDPLFAALVTLKNTLTEMASSAWGAITDFFTPVGDFFSGLWRNYGAPVMDWLGEVAGDLWSELQNLGATIWGWTQPVREWSSDAWSWVKDQLGMSDANEGEGGISSWISDKIGEVWRTIKQELQPVIEPVQQVATKIGELLPLETIANLRDQVAQWADQVGSMTETMNQPNGVADEQTSLRETILPAVMAHIANLRLKLIEAGVWVGGKIADLATSVSSFIAGLRATPLVSLAANALDWVETKINTLSSWAQGTVTGLFNLVGNALARLSRFIEPILNVLRQIVEVVGNLAGKLPDLIMGPLWWILPACIRNPIKNFLLTQILARIPIFSQLMAIPDAWAQIRVTALRILRQVFVDGNLGRAAWTFFSAILHIFNIPPELVVGIMANAAAAIGDILRNPVSFLINLLRAVREGFTRFFNNFIRHMLGGISGWLFGHLANAGITPPATFDLQGVLGVVLQILDITRERIFQRLARQIGQAATDRLRRTLDMATGAWEWVATLMREGPGGLWRILQARLSNLWNTVINGIVGWLSTNIITRVTARLLSMLDPSGVMAVVNSFIAVYRAIQSFMAYLRQMLEIINSVLQGITGIARGAISQAAGFLESAMARAIPVAIGFLANQVGLGDLGPRIRLMVERVRSQVDRALDWIISRALRMGRAVLDLLRRGVSAVRGGVRRLREWWRSEKRFTASNGERHRIYIEGQGQSARLMIASRPTSFTDFTRNLNGANKTRAETVANELDSLMAEAARAPAQQANSNAMAGRDYASEINAKMQELADITAASLSSPSQENPLTVSTARTVPAVANQLSRAPSFGSSNLSVGGESSTVGTNMVAHYLTQANAASGSNNTGPAQNDIYGFNKLPQRGAFGGRGYRGNQVYIKGHLLNNHIGGPASPSNLYPITARANGLHYRRVEKQVKSLVLNSPKNRANAPLVVMYSVQVINQSSPIKIDVLSDNLCTYYYINAAFNCSYATYRLQANNSVVMNSPTSITIDSSFDEPGFSARVRRKRCPQSHHQPGG